MRITCFSSLVLFAICSGTASAHELEHFRAFCAREEAVLPDKTLYSTRQKVIMNYENALAAGVEQLVAAANKNLNLYADAIREIAAKSGELFIDLQAVQRSSDKQFNLTENGVHLSGYGYRATATAIVAASGGEVSQSENDELRELIQRKNELFFHRWRPQNFIDLLGFRKHEQGQNAFGIAEFDPLIEELETKIHDLKTKN